MNSDQMIAELGLQQEIQKLKWALDRTTPKDAAEPFRRSFTIDAMSRDATVAAALEATVNVTSLFEPVLEGMPDRETVRPGEAALWFAVKGIERLSWEEICTFREHPGSAEARARLRAAEERVVAEGGEQGPDFRERVGREVTHDVLAALAETKPDLAKELKEDAANIGVSFVPVVGPAISGLATVGETLADAAAANRTWHAALMTLRKPESP